MSCGIMPQIQTRLSPSARMSEKRTATEEPVVPGEAVYDGNGQLIGHVSRFTDDGFEAETVLPDDEDGVVIPGQEFGEGFLVWRCGECGAMDELEDGLPQSCPECGAPRPAITPVLED